jgi:hypothetical protein
MTLACDSDPRFTGWGGGLPACYREQVVVAAAVNGPGQEEHAVIAGIGVAKILENLGLA